MKRAWMFSICVLGLVVGLACGMAGAGSGDTGSAGTGSGDTEPVGESTGDTYMLNGNGCPDGFTYVRSGGSYGGCTFEHGSIVLEVYCNGEFNRDFNRFESGPVWRSDSEPSKRGLQVFWPGGDGVDGKGFACVKERCFDCE